MALEVRKAGDPIIVCDADLEDVTNGDPETTYTLRTITRDIIRDLQKPYLKQQFNKRTHSLEDVPLSKEDDAALMADILDYVIASWDGILYQGQPLPCDKTTKPLLDMDRKSTRLNSSH